MGRREGRKEGTLLHTERNIIRREGEKEVLLLGCLGFGLGDM